MRRIDLGRTVRALRLRGAAAHAPARARHRASPTRMPATTTHAIAPYAIAAVAAAILRRDPVHRHRAAPRTRHVRVQHGPLAAGRAHRQHAAGQPAHLRLRHRGLSLSPPRVAAPRATQRARARARAAHAAHAGIAPAGDAGVHRAAVPVRHARGRRAPARVRPAHRDAAHRRAHRLPARGVAAPARIDLDRRQGDRARARVAQHPAPASRPAVRRSTSTLARPREGASMPPMVLLPLVDYAVRTTLARRSGYARASAVRASEATLRFAVAAGDGARGPSAAADRQARRRCASVSHTLYGDTAQLTLGSRDDPHRHTRDSLRRARPPEARALTTHEIALTRHGDHR